MERRYKLCRWQKRVLVVLLLFLCSVLYSNGQSLTKQLDAVVESYVEKGLFSGAVLVAKDNKVLLTKGYGFADRARGIKNGPGTKFLIGSTTKSFTAVAAMQLVENGALDLHVPVSTYLPTLKPEIGRITVHQLLKMTSGLEGHLGRVTELKYEDITAAELVELINRSKIGFEPGTSYQYSNLNYQLTACIIEMVAGMQYEEVLRRNTFDPIGMQNSGNETTSMVPPNKAVGYTKDESGTLSGASRNYMSYALGSGDIYSTVEDLYRWDRALQNSDYLNKKSRELLFDGKPDVNDGYGYGFKIREYERALGKGKLVRHGGSMRGYLANYHHYEEDDITIIILGNLRPFPITDITFDLKEVVLGRAPGRENKTYRY